MPEFLRESWNRFEAYSPPLSEWRVLILQPDCRSTIVSHCLNFRKTSSLDFRKEIQVNRECSSVNVTPYLAPPSDVGVMGPKRSVWTVSNFDAGRVRGVRDIEFVIFPMTQDSQGGAGEGEMFMPETYLGKAETAVKLRWPSRLCHVLSVGG